MCEAGVRRRAFRSEISTHSGEEWGERQPELAGEVLRRWMARSGLVRATDRARVWDAWQRLLGAEAAQTCLEGLRNHVAYFSVDSSALLSELAQFRKQELLEGLHEEVRQPFVRDLRFRLDKRRTPSAADRKQRSRPGP